jgi:NitT/TauT family transport system permease protein
MKKPLLFGVHADPTGWKKVVLAILPFLALILLYSYVSHVRHIDNPDDKLFPTFVQMKNAVAKLAFTQDVRTGEYTMLHDTVVTVRRLFYGLSLSVVVGFLLGINLGVFKGLEAVSLSFVKFSSMIVPPAVLPIILIAFGVEEVSKVMFIFLSICPMITLCTYNEVKKIPLEQITKSLTLGATPFGLVYRLVMPQMIPSLISNTLVALGSAWVFVIVAEFVAAAEGLGYRIALMRRYLAMDVILPYVLWVIILGLVMDKALQLLLNWKYKWYSAESL